MKIANDLTKSIKISIETHLKLQALRLELLKEKKRNVTIDEVISGLL